MKKIMILAAAAVFSFGCSGNDDNASGTTSIDGTWKLTALTSSQPTDANEDGVATTDLIAEAGCFDQTTLVFASNNTFVYNLMMPGTTTCFPFTANGTYVASGNNIAATITVEGEADTQNFVQSGNTLTATVPDFYEIEVTVGGETTYESIDAVLVFTKQ
ncbi:lipocalin-like domain-containing protein [Flavobacterium silvaticum]|uniref:Lipocalin family protein n=1 Tax=Flavobacterium silvaticum TaxID=1852020 RepID=A0A972JEI9_9FLAO|nr:lipocalin family protein [Flavobacterium silvaticum]NMH26939.1 lipocalin family protein [Flavobacterium silvaticum]